MVPGCRFICDGYSFIWSDATFPGPPTWPNGVSSVPDTISLHRKKQSNSLYTINALNELVKKLNNGVLDNSFPIPWENYRNRLLLTNDEGLYEIPTRVYSIIHTKTWKSDFDEK